MNASRVAVIVARGGSRRIPLKAIKDFHGAPMLSYPIRAALASKMFNRVFVSTDHEGIAKVARDYGAEVVERPEYLARDEVGTQAVMRHTLEVIGPRGRHACCIYPCSPLLESRDFWRAYRKMIAAQVDYCFSPGILYWGRVFAFLHSKPLKGPIYGMDRDRGIDINVEHDWKVAEMLYAKLHPTKVAA